MKLDLSELLGNTAKSEEVKKETLPVEVSKPNQEEPITSQDSILSDTGKTPEYFNYNLDPLDVPTKKQRVNPPAIPTNTHTHTHTYIEEVCELLDRKPYDIAVFRAKLKEDSIRRIDEIKAQIEEDVKGTVDPFTLVFQLLDIVGLLEGDIAYSTSLGERIKRIYGEGLLKRTPLLKRKEELQSQLARLEESLANIENDEYGDGYTITSLKGAITIHKMRIEEIDRKLSRYR